MLKIIKKEGMFKASPSTLECLEKVQKGSIYDSFSEIVKRESKFFGSLLPAEVYRKLCTECGTEYYLTAQRCREC